MITILDGKLTVPENQRFIGFAGDNLNRTIEFVVKNHTSKKNIYRLYLTFDDGTVNYFTLPATITSEGTVLTWEIQKEHIFKPGLVSVQIKAFCESGVIFHTNKETFIAGSSSEFSDFFKENNTEFIEYEKKLNELKSYIEETVSYSPYIGENGNWFIFDNAQGAYVDSGKPSVGDALTSDIADGAVTSAKIASGAVTAEKLGQYSVRTDAIVPEAVTRDKLAKGAVDAEVIARNAINKEHFSESFQVSADMLSESYWRVKSFSPATSYTDLDAVFDDDDNTKTIYRFKFSGLSPVASVLGNGDYVAFVSSENNTLTLIGVGTADVWVYDKGSNILVKDETSDESEVDFYNAGTFLSLDKMKEYPFELSKTYRFFISSSMQTIPYGQYIGSCIKIDEGEPRTLEFSSFIPDGKGYALDLESGSLIIKDITEDFSNTLGDIEEVLSKV